MVTVCIVPTTHNIQLDIIGLLIIYIIYKPNHTTFNIHIYIYIHTSFYIALA